ncbi:hypothetical protein [Streptomyces indicus]|uniref:Uncharacterized protein n=1 Tax=Streptomyces indicus TaxID=417292 RepID=A0A1G9ET30_9ACTN|nr:hypothetical protein [Streptomyces indicus]SDK79337.1 hypothetical protein SAMN05421806_11249 [Streptomyces indicus]
MSTFTEPIVAKHWLALAAPKAAPAIATSTVLILARIWNANGAEHDLGGASLMTVLAVGAAAAGTAMTRLGEPAFAATGYATSGALALSGVAAYSDGIALPLLLWALATILAYCCTARLWRTDRREQVAFERERTERQEEHAHIERVTAIEAGSRIEVARAGAQYAEQLATALIHRAGQPAFDPAALTAAGLPQLPSASDEITKEF